MAFEWDLVNSNGAGFTLLREPKHTDDDITLAKKQIRDDRDVVMMNVERE